MTRRLGGRIRMITKEQLDKYENALISMSPDRRKKIVKSIPSDYLNALCWRFISRSVNEQIPEMIERFKAEWGIA